MDWSWLTSPGVALMGPRAPTAITAWARAVEAAWLGSVWIIEDYFHPGAYALAGAAAAVTERVTIGLGVVNPYTRHPALLAMETGALAGLAPGRVVLGVGSSNRLWIEERMGIPFKTPLGAIRECVEIVRRLLAGERLTWTGPCFTLSGVALEVTPPAPVPVFLGVKGPKALRLAGEIADGVHGAVLTSPGHVRRARETAGAARDPGAAPLRVVAYLPLAIDDDSARARDALRPLVGRYLGFLHGQSILADAGLGPDRTQALRDALGAGRDPGALVTDAMLDAVAVAGTPAECRQALGRWAEAGLDAPIFVLPPRADVPGQLARIGRDLAPAWAARRGT